MNRPWDILVSAEQWLFDHHYLLLGDKGDGRTVDTIGLLSGIDQTQIEISGSSIFEVNSYKDDLLPYSHHLSSGWTTIAMIAVGFEAETVKGEFQTWLPANSTSIS